MARRCTRLSTCGQNPPAGNRHVQEDSAYDCDTEATPSQAKELSHGQKAALTRKRNQMAQMNADLDSEPTGKGHCNLW